MLQGAREMKHNENSIRVKLSRILVKLAKKIDPESQEVNDFYMKLFTDQMIYGKHVVRINPVDTLLHGDEK